MGNRVGDISTLDVEADYSWVLLLSVWARARVELLRVADKVPKRADSLRNVPGEAKTRLTSRGASFSAAADDANCAARNVEYFITALGIAKVELGAVYM